MGGSLVRLEWLKSDHQIKKLYSVQFMIHIYSFSPISAGFCLHNSFKLRLRDHTHFSPVIMSSVYMVSHCTGICLLPQTHSGHKNSPQYGEIQTLSSPRRLHTFVAVCCLCDRWRLCIIFRQLPLSALSASCLCLPLSFVLSFEHFLTSLVPIWNQGSTQKEILHSQCQCIWLTNANWCPSSGRD